MIVTSPTHDWFKAALENCSKSFAVASPYIGRYLNKAVADLDGSVSLHVLTRTVLSDFARGASDLEAVHDLAINAKGITSLSSLHAKVYVIDRREALITSANATFSGMYRNRECGYLVSSQREVIELVNLIVTGFGQKPVPERWMAEDIAELRPSVEALRAALPREERIKPITVEATPIIRLKPREMSRFTESLFGWLQLTWEGVLDIETDTFTMNEVLTACAPLAAERFPLNHHVREKLRQQMQRLRDLGLVLFLGQGRYLRLALTI